MSEAMIDRRSAVTATARRFAFPTQTAFLSQAVLLEEAGPPRAPALVCLLGFAFVAIAILAGMLIHIDVVSSSAGQIKAAVGNLVIQSFDGGIVDRVEVEEGQIVDPGDLLLTLTDPEGEAQLDRLIPREAALSAQVHRLKMLVDLPSAAPTRQLNEARAAAMEQMSILPIEREALIVERSLAMAEIDRRSKTLGSARAQEDGAILRLSLIRDKLKSDRQLHAKGLLPKAQLLEVEQEAIDAASELTEIRGQIRDAEASLAESNRRLDNVVAGRKQRQGDQLSSVMIELNETRGQMGALRRRLERSQIKATTRGVVLDLKVRHQGQTVAPGDPIVEIIPIEGGLLAETRLAPSEISHVHPEQSVRIAIDGIEPHRHGYLEGKVETISPSTFVDDSGLPYYRVSIGLASGQLDGLPLTPGMTVQVQIKTGQRTILEYLLKPVYRAWNSAFRER
ncbi:MAG: HlyD family type I secretion periplasmic adaptor subunit [Alphaproteobacteria bacterium]|nr:HlyD family type I secretion periplasmic adaptor subunit [Alphaproteobacteria bacterium]